MYKLEVLGGVLLEGPTGPLSGYATQSRQLALLALLGAAGDAGCSRDKLLAYLFPESNEASARHSLADAVYRLKKSLGPDAVVSGAGTLRLNPGVIRCDVGAFESALEVGDLAAAAKLYRGPFLDGFHLRESSEFEEWKDAETRRLESMCERLTETLAERAESAGDYLEAVELWRRLTEHDPLNSRTALRLMRAQAEAGDPANAILYGQQHAELLKRELGVEPPAELVDLAERLRTASSAPDSAGSRRRVPKLPRLPFFGSLDRRHVVTALANEAEAPTGAEPSGTRAPEKHTHPGRWLLVTVPLAVAVIGAGMWLGTRGTPVERLAVVPLENLTDDPDVDLWGQLAAEWMGNAIDRAGPILVVPATSVRDAMKTLGADPSVTSVAERVRASHALAGRVARTGDEVRFHVEFLDVRTGERLRALDPVTGPADSVQAVVSRLAAVAAAAAMVLLDPDAPPMAHERALPPSLAAYRLGLQAEELGCQTRYEEALDAANEAQVEAPNYRFALFQSYGDYAAMGRAKEADSVTSRLEAVRDRMTRWEQLILDRQLALRRGDRAAAYRILEEQYRIAPSVAGYSAGISAMLQRRLDDAVERFLAYDIDAPCNRDWIWWWTSLAETYHAMGRYEDELDVVRRGLERFPNDLRLMSGEARVLAATGRLEAVDSVLDAMDALPPQEGLDPIHLTLVAALELRAHGHPDAAEAVIDRALEAVNAQPPEEHRFARAGAFYFAGRYQDADTLLAALIRDGETRPYQGGVPATDIVYIGSRGISLARMGRRAEALEMDRRLAAYPTGGMSYPGTPSFWRARIAAVLGDRDAAVRHYQEALERGHTWLSVHIHPDFDDMWGYPPWEALLAPR